MNDAVYSVTCPYCCHRQIVEVNSPNYAKKVPIFYPISPETAIGGLGGPSGHVSQHATPHVISSAKGTHDSIQQVSNVPSPPSWVSALNIFAFVKVIYRWAKEEEKFGGKDQNEQDLWLTVTCNKCRNVYLYNHQTRDYVRIRPDAQE